MLRIRDALPRLFHKAYPVIDPKTEMLPAMSLLRFHEIDALPLGFQAGGQRHHQRALLGFSSLARLILLKPKEFAGFLKTPCSSASEPLASVDAGRDLSRLLDTFAKTRFGFASVGEGENVGALAGLMDVLGLYESKAISADLSVDAVGTKVVSTPGSTSLRAALGTMFGKRHRRIFISGTNEFVSDRAIIDHVFSPQTLSSAGRNEGDIFGVPLSSVASMRARQVESDLPLAEAARLLRAQGAGQCLVFDGSVTTPWDVVMKPWIGGKLKSA